MNTHEDTQNPHPFDYWTTAVDRLVSARLASAFEREGADRRAWRLLTAVDGATATDRPLNPRALHDLVDRGWITRDGDGWALTDEGRAAKERLDDIVSGIRATMADAVSPEDFETTVATLEKIATALGWEDGMRLPRRKSHRHGHGRGRTHDERGSGRRHADDHDRGRRAGHRHGGRGPHGFGPGSFGARDFGPHGFGPGSFGPHGFGPHGFGPGSFGPRSFGPHGFGPGESGAHEHRGHDGRERGDSTHGGFAHDRFAHRGHRFARMARRAYERGFDAGFTRGRDA